MSTSTEISLTKVSLVSLANTNLIASATVAKASGVASPLIPEKFFFLYYGLPSLSIPLCTSILKVVVFNSFEIAMLFTSL